MDFHVFIQTLENEKDFCKLFMSKLDKYFPDGWTLEEDTPQDTVIEIDNEFGEYDDQLPPKVTLSLDSILESYSKEPPAPLIMVGSTQGWYLALKETFEELNLKNLLDYYDDLEWMDSDNIDGVIENMVVEKLSKSHKSDPMSPPSITHNIISTENK